MTSASHVANPQIRVPTKPSNRDHFFSWIGKRKPRTILPMSLSAVTNHRNEPYLRRDVAEYDGWKMRRHDHGGELNSEAKTGKAG
ncbi:hypothetical protein M413DRAFT_239959 [Hebeloma cylindrosporum]|uniref:Uncharacterized protein n=1 Tax=Hebeloma cylindrosporum TaxID=76867 RepID=A0A0C3BPU1_HEBCY|nr:hypothetical protein M413DRAFT_239959 [Hebeloma cylindrosporum h7]